VHLQLILGLRASQCLHGSAAKLLLSPVWNRLGNISAIGRLGTRSHERQKIRLGVKTQILSRSSRGFADMWICRPTMRGFSGSIAMCGSTDIESDRGMQTYGQEVYVDQRPAAVPSWIAVERRREVVRASSRVRRCGQASTSFNFTRRQPKLARSLTCNICTFCSTCIFCSTTQPLITPYTRSISFHIAAPGFSTGASGAPYPSCKFTMNRFWRSIIRQAPRCAVTALAY